MRPQGDPGGDNGGDPGGDNGGDPGGDNGGDGDSSSGDTAAQLEPVEWVQRFTRSSPGRITRHRMVFHTVRGETMLYGGNTCETSSEYCPTADLWSYDGDDWTRLSADCPPGARQDHGLVFDASRSRLVLFGGRTDGGTVLGDLWEWRDGVWEQPAASGTPPSPRHTFFMAYDEGRSRTVIFGGQDASSQYLDDVFEWDGATWTGPLTPTQRPGARRGMDGAAYDGQRILVFGGANGSMRFDDLWAWDGSSWERPCDNCTGTANSSPAVAWNPQTAELVVATGNSGTEEAGTWSYAAGAWSTFSTFAPPRRDSSTMVFDTRRGRLVFFGGNGPSCGATPPVNCDDTLEQVRLPSNLHDGQRQWVRRYFPTEPVKRRASKLVWMESSQAVFMYGGSISAVSYLADAWMYDGDSWQLVCDPCPPGPRRGAAVVYDRERQRVVLFGGATDDTTWVGDLWEWDGSNWTEPSPTGTAPTPRRDMLAAFDVGRKVMVVFGGRQDADGMDDLYEYDGSHWVGPLVPTPRPPARYDEGQAAAFDGAEVVLLGGRSNFADSWSWNGARWQQQCSDCLGMEIRTAALAWDSDRDVLVVATGYGNSNELASTWERHGTWQLLCDYAPSERDGAAMVYDPRRGRMVLFGGNGDTCTEDQNQNCAGTLEYVVVPP